MATNPFAQFVQEEVNPFAQFATPTPTTPPGQIPGAPANLVAPPSVPAREVPSITSKLLGGRGPAIGNILAGGIRGAGSIGATLLRPFETAEENISRRRAITDALTSMGAQPESAAFSLGKIATEVAGTAGIGGAIAAPVQLAAKTFPALAPVVTALQTGGTGAQTILGRATAGATVGGAGATLIEPSAAETGAAIGAAVPFVAPAVGAVIGKIADLKQLPTQRAARIARDAIGRDIDEVLPILRNARPGASVAEITADLDNPAWQALIDKALTRDPQFLRKMQVMGDRQVRTTLADLARGATATDVRASLEIAKKNLNALQGPAREAALSRANLGQSVADYEARAGRLSKEAASAVQEVRDLISRGEAAEAWARLDLIKRGLPVGATKYTYFGELSEKAFNEWADKAANASLDLGQGARFAQGAADALRAQGIKPLETKQLLRGIRGLTRQPEYAGNDLLSGAANNLIRDIKQFARNGVIDARALEAIRKNSVNAAIQQLRPGVDATTQRNLASSVLSDIKPLIDNAIEGAGGRGWVQYLDDYSQGMRKIAERELVGDLAQLWKNDKTAFADVVMRESPETIEKVLGPGKYDIARELADDVVNQLRTIATQRLRQVSASEQATQGQVALTEILNQNSGLMRIPNRMQAWIANTNLALAQVERAVGQKTMMILTNAMKDPQKAANLLSVLPGKERSRVAAILANPPIAPAAAARGALVATMAPEEQQPQGIMSPEEQQ
jgi:hypothetical protein